MKGVNRVTLVGNLGGPPELMVSKNGKNYCRLRLVTEHRRQKDDGTWEDVPEWHSVFVWGRLAEICVHNLRKGALVAVEGHLTYWKETENGVFKNCITADDVHFANRSPAFNAAPAENLDNPEAPRNHNAVAHPA